MQEEGVCVCRCWRIPFSFSLPLKNIFTKAVFCSACHYAKSFSLEDNGCSQRKIYMGSPECNELPHSSCLGLGVVTCKWFEIRTECGKMRSYRIPPLAFFFFFLWQIIFHPPRPQPLSETLDQVWRTEVPTGQIL